MRAQAIRESAQAADEIEMLTARQEGVEVRVLRYVADASFVLDQAIADVDPVEPDLAGRGFPQSGQDGDRGGFARPVRPQQTEDRARLPA